MCTAGKWCLLIKLSVCSKSSSVSVGNPQMISVASSIPGTALGKLRHKLNGSYLRNLLTRNSKSSTVYCRFMLSNTFVLKIST